MQLTLWLFFSSQAWKPSLFCSALQIPLQTCKKKKQLVCLTLTWISALLSQFVNCLINFVFPTQNTHLHDSIKLKHFTYSFLLPFREDWRSTVASFFFSFFLHILTHRSWLLSWSLRQMFWCSPDKDWGHFCEQLYLFFWTDFFLV